MRLQTRFDPVREFYKLARRVELLEKRVGPWIYVGTYPGDPFTTDDSPAFQNGFFNFGDGTSTADQLTRFRWRIGGPTEFQINVDGGGMGLVIFSVGAGYWPQEGKQTYSGADKDGNHQPYTVVPNGVGADIYLGRV